MLLNLTDRIYFSLREISDVQWVRKVRIQWIQPRIYTSGKDFFISA